MLDGAAILSEGNELYVFAVNRSTEVNVGDGRVVGFTPVNPFPVICCIIRTQQHKTLGTILTQFDGLK